MVVVPTSFMTIVEFPLGTFRETISGLASLLSQIIDRFTSTIARLCG